MILDLSRSRPATDLIRENTDMNNILKSMLNVDTSFENGLGTHSNVHVLFQIRSFTYVELRDCSLVSKNKAIVMDAAFIMNERDLCENNFENTGKFNLNQNPSPYRGILSVKSCTI